MKKNATRLGLVAVALMLVLPGTFVVAGPLGTLDDFSTAGLAEYTLTPVLDNGATEANVSFSDATGSLVASYAGSVNQPEQVVFLRSDATLAIGETLVVDVSQAASTSQMDFGLAVSSTLTPTTASAVDPDTRDTFNWASVSVRPSQNAIRVNSSVDGVVTTGAGVLTAEETTVSQLFIQRNTSTNFIVGYVDTGMISHNALSINFTATDVGTAIGFYADLRANLGTLGGMDNLRLVASPLPGDVTGDGMINIDDFNVIKTNLFNTGQTRIQGDLTGDTIVDFADFRQWKTAAGSGFASVSLFGVPEPSAILLSSVGGFLLATLIRSRRSRG